METSSSILALLASMALGLDQANAATLRCGRELISEGDTALEVRENVGNLPTVRLLNPRACPMATR